MATKNLVVKFLGKDSSLQAAFRRSRKALKSFSVATRGLRTALKSIGIAAAIAGAALVALGVRAVNAIDRFSKFSDSTGAAVGQLQLFKAAMQLGGGSFDSFVKMVEKVGRTIGKELITPSAEVGDVLKKLGVSLKELEGRSAINLFQKLLPLILKLDDAGQRAAGNALFGRGFAKDLAALKQLEANLKRARKNLKDTDLLLGGAGGPGPNRRIVDQKKWNESQRNGVKSVVALKDAYEDLSQILGAFQLKVAEALGPSMNKLLEGLRDATRAWFKEMGGGTAVAQKVATAFITRLPRVIKMFEALGEIVIAIASGLKAAAESFAKVKAFTERQRESTPRRQTFEELEQARARTPDFSQPGAFTDRVLELGAVEAILEVIKVVTTKQLTEQESQTRHLQLIEMVMRQGARAQ